MSLSSSSLDAIGKANGKNVHAKEIRLGDSLVPKKTLLVVDSQVLDRECLADSIAARQANWAVASAASLDEWLGKKSDDATATAVLYCVGGRKFTDAAVVEEVRALVANADKIPVVVLADSDELTQIMRAIECGVRGYIPSSFGVEVCIEAVRLALTGALFVPASSLMASRAVLDASPVSETPLGSMFTLRQAEVVEALRRGKANKIIAYELNLRESTVKVHIRNIMKKMQATNRTEVAYKLNDMLPKGYAALQPN